MNNKSLKIIGFFGVGLGLIASLISDYAKDKQQENLIDEKIEKALAERENEIES